MKYHVVAVFCLLLIAVASVECAQKRKQYKSPGPLKKEFCDVKKVPEARCGLCKCNKAMTTIQCVSCPTEPCPDHPGPTPSPFVKRDIHECCPPPECY